MKLVDLEYQEGTESGVLTLKVEVHGQPHAVDRVIADARDLPATLRSMLAELELLEAPARGRAKGRLEANLAKASALAKPKE